MGTRRNAQRGSKVSRRPTAAPAEPCVISTETLDRMAAYFLLMGRELLDLRLRKDIKKVMKEVKERFPEGWRPQD